jgi:acylaminoacyl-peptidase
MHEVMVKHLSFIGLLILGISPEQFQPAVGQTSGQFELMDVFQLEYASDPQISPDGERIVYVRNFMDIMKDRARSNLWTVDKDGGNHRPITTGTANDASPRWSPDGSRIAYVSSEDGSRQLYVRWMDTGQVARATQLTESPGTLSWSPDGRWIAFTMRVEATSEPMATLPPAPDGAEWAPSARVITSFNYRRDRGGFASARHNHVFIVPSEGGSPRQITTGPYNHSGPLSWMPDGRAIVFSANRREGAEYDPRNSEIYRVDVATGEVDQLTDRQGPDFGPVVAPDGRIAYLGFDDRYKGYQLNHLYVMEPDGSATRPVVLGLDRSISRPVWSADGTGLYFTYDDLGRTHIGYTSVVGAQDIIAEDVGGTTIGRPYASGQYSVARGGELVYTYSRPNRPSDLRVMTGDAPPLVVTNLNHDLLAVKDLAEIEEIWFESAHDGREIQGWIATPPGFDPSRKYPLILEIHGGPFSNYGPRFSAEIQLYAAAGYVVVYINPRGSTSYGEEFGNLIHHNYPGQDYDDLMSGVDAVIRRGYIDENALFVTGGSGGGVLTAWIVGKTDRFKAAVVAKPVINWYSFSLTTDGYGSYYKYWFPGFPWDHQDHYMARSPISLVGNVTTPTMLLTGEEDFRTPMSETEQYYQALKLRKVETAMVRIPGASHSIAARPSHLMSKVAHVLAWFERH